MPRSIEAQTEPSILEWARATAGFSIEEAATSLQTKPEKILAWERGQAKPSMAQLRKMSVAYKRLLSDFYLPAAPREEPLPHDFRRLPGEVAYRYSRPLRYQLRLARQRRELALDLADELDFVFPVIREHLERDSDTERAGADLRRFLGVVLDAQRSWREPRVSYNNWRRAVERKGILVFQVARISTKEMLGFSMSERPLPVISINRKLRPNGRTFTLLHECAHVFIGMSSICDIDEGERRPPEEQAIEVYCNAVAAAALVPFDALLGDPLVRSHRADERNWSDDELSALSRCFGVSEEVILRRLLTAGRTSQDFYNTKHGMWGALMDNIAPPDPEAEIKRNMPQEILSDLGRPLVGLILDSYQDSLTSLSDVSRHLGLRAEQVTKVQELLSRG